MHDEDTETSETSETSEIIRDTKLRIDNYTSYIGLSDSGSNLKMIYLCCPGSHVILYYMHTCLGL